MALAEQAVRLDSTLAGAHMTLAAVRFYWDWDWSAAERGVRRALGLNPNAADAHRFLAEVLSVTGRHDEALRAIERGPGTGSPVTYFSVQTRAYSLPEAGLPGGRRPRARDAGRAVGVLARPLAAVPVPGCNGATRRGHQSLAKQQSGRPSAPPWRWARWATPLPAAGHTTQARGHDRGAAGGPSPVNTSVLRSSP